MANTITCGDVIATVDELRPNEFTDAQKLSWLSVLDRKLLTELVLPRESDITISDTTPESPQTGDRWWQPGTSSLYIRTNGEWASTLPYKRPLDRLVLGDDASELYRLYLLSEIDFYNAEYVRYNNESTRYNVSYMEYEKHYNRTHRSIDRHWFK